MRVAIYVRKSVHKDDSVSLETQIESCKEFLNLKYKDYDFEVFEDDGKSGGDMNRPAFIIMMKLIDMKKFDMLIVYKTDRFSRNTIDGLTVIKHLREINVEYISTKEDYDTTTTTGYMVITILLSLGEKERSDVKIRVNDAMLTLNTKGCWTGGKTPVGFNIIKIDGKTYLQNNPDENDFVIDMYGIYAKSVSLYAAHYILKNKYPKLESVNIENLKTRLRSVMYVKSSYKVNNFLGLNNWQVLGEPNGNGYLKYTPKGKEKIAVVSKHSGIIDEDLWIQTQIRLMNKKEEHFRRPSKTYWLCGILKCPICGSNVNIINSNNHRYYVCSKRVNRGIKGVGNCTNSKYLKAEEIESKVNEALNNIESKDDFINEFTKPSFKDNNYLVLEKENKKIDTRINNLISQIMDMSNESAVLFKAKINELSYEKLTNNIKIDELKAKELECTPNLDKLFESLNGFKKSHNALDKRNWLRIIFKSITYNPVTDTVSLIIN